jgi:hypothetical protein
MSKLLVDITDKPDDFKIILFPTSYSSCPKIVIKTCKNHINIAFSYYYGLQSKYFSIKKPLDCNFELEKENLINNLKINKITDTFEITKKDFTEDIIKNFRWCEPFIEFTEQPFVIDPYILGLWLGDGSSDSLSLTSIDKIIIDYWYKYAKDNNLFISVNNIKERKTETKEGELSQVCVYLIHNGKGHSNILLENFKKLNLIKNKHIPDIYLNNSKEVRLKVLAGLIDTDGHLSNGTYEIIQKNEKLSNDIITLAKSLGFFCTKIIKTAYAANTEEKTVRNYYRIIIYVNQINDPIPVLLDRKKINSKDKKFFHNPIILINGNKTKEKAVWNEDLDNLLKESVKKYQSTKGKKLIPWTKITNEIESFKNISPNALRKHYQDF